jgi:hypothetical protein
VEHLPSCRLQIGDGLEEEELKVLKVLQVLQVLRVINIGSEKDLYHDGKALNSYKIAERFHHF